MDRCGRYLVISLLLLWCLPRPVISSTCSIPASYNVTEKTTALQIAFVNNSRYRNLRAYITGLDSANRATMVTGDGKFYSPAMWTNSSDPRKLGAQNGISLGTHGERTSLTMPGYLTSARIWVSDGVLPFRTVHTAAASGVSFVEPSAVDSSDACYNSSWGFVEFSHSEAEGLYADVSYVDFVGLPLGMSLLSGDGQVQVTNGIRSGALDGMCASLKAYAAEDGQPWDHLCHMDGQGRVLRILAPTALLSSNASAFDGYYQDYVDKVWTRFSHQPLVIDTQGEAGLVTCRVQNDLLTCDGDVRPFAKPQCRDMFGCSTGPFALRSSDTDLHRSIVPRLCAAFVRTTLMLSEGDRQPGPVPDRYYSAGPTNRYSALVHENEVDGRGYAFPFDDVNVEGWADQSGTLAARNPRVLSVFVTDQ